VLTNQQLNDKKRVGRPGSNNQRRLLERHIKEVQGKSFEISQYLT
jgi:hypothetical protein